MIDYKTLTVEEIIAKGVRIQIIYTFLAAIARYQFVMRFIVIHVLECSKFTF